MFICNNKNTASQIALNATNGHIKDLYDNKPITIKNNNIMHNIVLNITPPHTITLKYSPTPFIKIYSH